MSATFDQAISVVLAHEGGWVSNPVDPGGETNFGISSLMIAREGIVAADLGLDPATQMPTLTLVNGKPHLEVPQPDYLKPMTVDAAKDIYRRFFWDKYHYDQLDDQTVATKLFDACVNMGAKHAHPIAQAAANDCTGWPGLTLDGILGNASMTAIDACDPQEFIKIMSDRLASYYQDLVVQTPKLRIFLKNWLKRAAWGIQP
jgi:lysozyme family protein